jgi:hypothetical protein
VPGSEGDIWVPNGSDGLYQVGWTNNLATFKKNTSVLTCEAVGFGKAAPGQAYPAVYIWGTVGLVDGVFRSDNKGVSWVQINDADHEFGGTGNANEVLGDPRVYGRVYMSTAGRGTVYGDLVDGPDTGYIYDTEYLPFAVSILEQNKAPLFRLQQNQNTSSVRIVSEEKGRYEIYSIIGSLLEDGRCDNSKEIAGGLLQGIYILRFTSDSGKSGIQKFMTAR